MPNHEPPFTDVDKRILEDIRLRMGLATIDDAADWLAKRALQRRLLQVNNGRGRAMHFVGGEIDEQ